MPLSDGLVLYHGSYVEVSTPDLSRCARYKDFGRGFYLTTSKEQATSFSLLTTRKAQSRGRCDDDQRFGVVSMFSFSGAPSGGLSVCEFFDADAAWLRCITAHRMRESYPEVVDAYRSYDVIIGKIANDQTNITLAAYMDGIFGELGSEDAERDCIRRLLPERLKDQYCFRTVWSLTHLNYEGSERVWL